MNYDEVVYQRLIRYRKSECPIEKSKDKIGEVEAHHIVPKSLGGTDDPDNLVNLTVLEHILAHKLLYYIYKFKPGHKRAFMKMTCAWHRMMSGHQGERINPTKRVREIAIIRLSIAKQLNERLNDIIIITDGTIEKEMNKHDQIPEGWSFVRFFNPGTKNKVWINNGIEQTLVFEKDIPDGWKRGQIPNESRSGGRMINNGIISAKLNKGDPLPDGWQYGFVNGGQKKGCRFVNNGVRTICIEPGDPIPDGFHSGYANKPEKRQCITDGNVFKAIPANQPIPDGWTHGQPKGKFKWITNGVECRKLKTGEDMPEGFKIVTTEYHSTKGKIAITDGKTTVFIKPGDIVPDGWKIGSSNKTLKGLKYYNNGKVQKAFEDGEQIPPGFTKGKLSFTFINNGIIMKKLVKGMPMPEGFVIGKIKKKTGVKQQG